MWVDQAAPELAQAEVSVVVESVTPTPVVVERSMWWRATPTGEWVEAHNSRGATATAARWLVADGEAGGAGQASTYVLVANTSGAAQGVRFTLLPEAGAPRTVTGQRLGPRALLAGRAGGLPRGGRHAVQRAGRKQQRDGRPGRRTRLLQQHRRPPRGPRAPTPSPCPCRKGAGPLRTSGHQDTDTGHQDIRTSGHQDTRTSGHQDIRKGRTASVS